MELVLRAAVVLALASGCFIKPSPPCAEPSDGAPRDDFSEPSNMACNGWATAGTLGDAKLTSGGGMLAFDVASNGGTGYCVSQRTWPFTDPIFIELSSVTTGEAYNSFTVCTPDIMGSGCNFGISINNGRMQFNTQSGTLTTIQYDPNAMRWLQLERTGGALHASYAPLFGQWTELDNAPMEDGDAKLTLQAGAYDNTFAGTTVFQNLDVCPG